MNNEKSSIFSVMSIDWSKYIRTTKEKNNYQKLYNNKLLDTQNFIKPMFFYRTPITRKMANIKERLND